MPEEGPGVQHGWIWQRGEQRRRRSRVGGQGEDRPRPHPMPHATMLGIYILTSQEVTPRVYAGVTGSDLI